MKQFLQLTSASGHRRRVAIAIDTITAIRENQIGTVIEYGNCQKVVVEDTFDDIGAKIIDLLGGR